MQLATSVDYTFTISFIHPKEKAKPQSESINSNLIVDPHFKY